MKTRALILLTNDDGVASPGLLAAAEAVCSLGNLIVVAPSTQQTGMGRGTPPVRDGVISIHHLRVGREDVPVYAVSGSPAQCVLYGALGIAPRKPDLVVSGINHGENMGTSVTGSGTVGAALQAAELGIPGLAMSFQVDPVYHYNQSTGLDWSVPAHFTQIFADAMLQVQLPFDVDVLKVDVPAIATKATPWRIARQSRQGYWRVLPPSRRLVPGALQELAYDLYIDWDTLESDSDISIFTRDRMVSVVPLSHDLTSRTNLDALTGLLRAQEQA